MKNGYTTQILLLVFVVLAAGIVAAGCLVYSSQQGNCRMDAERKLTAVADLKVGELAAWRKERMADAGIFHKNSAFSALVRRSIERPQDLSAQEELRTWLSRVQANYCYDRVALLDAAGNKWMSVPYARAPLSSVSAEKGREALRTRKLIFEDFRRNEYTKKIYLRLFVPIFDGPTGRRPLGVLMLRVDPSAYLYSFIERWPTPRETAETLLIRREGNEAVFLNELRFQKNTALTLRVPLDSIDVPAVKAALGQEGIVEGIDYRGEPVLAAILAVPDSPWFLVAKMDMAEVYSSMQEKFWLAVIFVGVLLFGTAAAVGLVWRQQQAQFYRGQMKAAEALLEVNANLATTLNSIGDAVISTDLAGKIVQMNLVAETLTGWTLAEAAGRPLAEVFRILNAETRQPAANPVAKVLKTGQIVGLANHTVLLARGGTERQIADNATPVRDADGPTLGVVLVFRDVTQGYTAAEALKVSEVRYRRLFEAAQDGILLLDAETGLITDVNPFLIELLGLSREVFLGKKVWELGFFKDSAFNQANFTELQQKEYIRYEDMPLETADGRRIDVEFVSNVYRVNHHKVIQCNVRDITDRRRAEESRRQSKEQLEQYTAALEKANKALEESKRLADCANRAKSEFLANMSHELRTPLNAVIGFSEGLLGRVDRHPLNEHQIARIGNIKTSGEHLLQLINDVLDIAKVESGKIDLHIATFDIEPLAREIGDLVEALARDKPAVRFTLDLEEHLPPIASDRDKIRQILVNLLSNGIKFTEQGSVALRIRRCNDSLLLSVGDTGMGISAEHQGRLFEQFYQVDQKTHRSLKGTGLGLAISKKFAELLGGTLTVESVQRQGSTFTLTVPLVFDRRKNIDRRQIVQQAPAPIAPASEGQQRRRVLCIEANPENGALLDDYLTEAGYRVILAANGTEGLRLAASERPKAIILDVMLPGEEGWGILYRLKADPATSHIPVIVATGLDEQRLGLFLGASEYLVKPVSHAQLLQAIQRLSLDPERSVRNVAVVDDDPSLLRLVRRILEKENYRVCTYESGEAFLAGLATQRLDAAIIDLLMPHMDGFQVIERLREHPACADIPVVVMTAKILSEDDFLQLDHSVCAVLQKDGASCQEAFHQLVNRLHLMETRECRPVDHPLESAKP
jgi:PAS domain S-box-containing protein